MGAANVIRYLAVKRMHARRRWGVGLECGVPIRMIDVDRMHFDAMLAHVPHDLGRGIESHGLRVEQGCCECIGITALEPGRGIDEEREACGVAFRKSVFTETFNLAETALGEVA